MFTRSAKLTAALCRPANLGSKINVATYSTAPYNRFASTSNPINEAEKNAVYELRTYDIKPECMPAFMQLTNEHIPLRIKHSPLTGYWTTEMGGINQVVHIWKYVDLDHRAAVRAELAKDTEWNTKYMDPMRPMLVSQKNLVLHKFPWSALNNPVNAVNIYELRTYTLKPGSLTNWANLWTQGLPSRAKFSKPIAVWFSDLGDLNTVVHLWPYASYADRVQIRRDANLEQSWRQLVEQTMIHVQHMNSKILLPTAFSPLK